MRPESVEVIALSDWLSANVALIHYRRLGSVRTARIARVFSANITNNNRLPIDFSKILRYSNIKPDVTDSYSCS
jgi:hypothetical protein